MKRTIVVLVLAAVVGGLLWLRGRQVEELADPGTVAYQSPLFANLVGRNVVELGVENLERAVELRLVRDDDGLWQMVDPLRARAFPAMVKSLVDALEQGVGRPAPALSLAEAGLEPPRAVLSFVEETPDGLRRGRLELGHADVEERYVYARIPDHPAGRREDGSALFLASRSFESFLDRDRDHFRDPLLLGPGPDVARIVRSGKVLLAGQDAPTDLGLVVERDGQGGWRVVEPLKMTADPDVANALCRALIGLRADRFLANEARDAEQYDFSAPTVRFELERLDGTRTVVEAALRDGDPDVPAENSRWIARVEGSDVVASVEARDLRPSLFDLETFFDQRLVRAHRNEFRAVELAVGERTLHLERAGGDWIVHAGTGSKTFPASHAVVEDLLSAFERATIASFPTMVGFPASDPPRTFVVRTVGDGAFSGAVGDSWRDAELGAEGLAFLREGDTLPGLISGDLGAWFAKDVQDFRRRLLWSHKEGEVSRVELVRGARELAYVRDGTQWLPAGATTDAAVVPRSFHELLERLLRTKVVAWLDEVPATTGETLVRLVLDGAERVLVVGRAGERVVATIDDGSPGGSAVELEGLWGELLAALLD